MLKFCGCSACRAGRHNTLSKCVTRRKIRSNRRKTKALLRTQKPECVETEKAFSIPYTD